MAKAKKLRKWVDVYPQGTTEGDEEQKFFVALGRNPKFEWRTVPALAKESNLTKERVEEIINKYWPMGMVVNNPKNEDQWAYWERVPHMVAGADVSITRSDQDDRIDKALGVVVESQPVKADSDGVKANQGMHNMVTYTGSPIAAQFETDKEADAVLADRWAKMPEDIAFIPMPPPIATLQQATDQQLVSEFLKGVCGELTADMFVNEKNQQMLNRVAANMGEAEKVNWNRRPSPIPTDSSLYPIII